MRYYETVFIARQDVTSSQVESMTQHYTSVIKEHGGEVTKTEFCGLRPLAYPIKKNKKGHYVLLNIAVKPEGLAEVERQMKISEDILRHLSVRVDALDNNPSALMQQRHYREDFHRNNYDDQNDQGDIVPDLSQVELIAEIQE
ncbi:MAG: 30S ribosomal protein S6 [Alphaproteobacteria bacterium]|nr:30S ribosomal protein S6 [Alphaproteobacteria bacterium]